MMKSSGRHRNGTLTFILIPLPASRPATFNFPRWNKIKMERDRTITETVDCGCGWRSNEMSHSIHFIATLFVIAIDRPSPVISSKYQSDWTIDRSTDPTPTDRRTTHRSKFHEKRKESSPRTRTFLKLNGVWFLLTLFDWLILKNSGFRIKTSKPIKQLVQ